MYDLLSPAGASTASAVVIRDNDAGQQVVTGLTEEPVADVAALCGALHRGMSSRATASTAMNSRSSRSHAIFTITLEQTCAAAAAGEGDADADAEAPALVTKVSKIHSVDLAGSERATKSHAKGERLREVRRGLG